MLPARTTALLAVVLTIAACGRSEPTAHRSARPTSTFVTAAAQPMSRIRAVDTVDETCRQPFRSTAAGSRIRIRLSNVMSATPLVLSAVTVGLRTKAAAVAATQPVVVSGATQTTLAPHAQVTSDPLDLPIRVGDDVVVSFAVRGTAQLSEHLVGAATGWCTGPHTGDHTRDVSGAAFHEAHPQTLVVDSLEVQTTALTGVLAVGDSLTDPPLPPDTYQRWTDVLARSTRRTVANLAIGGNRVLLPGGYGRTLLERFDDDVLSRRGASTLVMFTGTNDVSAGVTPEALTGRLDELCTKARARGLRIVILTLAPAWRRTPALERTRQQVNDWIRTTTAADVHVDIDRLLRDPAQSTHLLPAYDLGDGLHLSAAGQAAVGRAVAAALSAQAG
jgi:lysophospholipase L1-like esterase